MNDTGEVEVEEDTYRVPIATDTPGSADTDTFCVNMADITTAPVDPIAFNVAQTRAFLADQYVYLREVCQIPVDRISEEALFEICFFRWLAYKSRLVCGYFVVADHHVHYNDAVISNAATGWSSMHTVRNHAHYAAGRNRLATWCNHNRAAVRKITNNFTNVVCTMAFVFRQKCHHYVTDGDYEET